MINGIGFSGMSEKSGDVEDFHALSVEEVLDRLKTSINGLSSEEAERRIEIYGYNELRVEERISPLKIWLSQFKNILIIILLAATAISYIVSVIEGEFPIDSIIIFAIVIAATTLGFAQEYRAEKALEALRKMLMPIVTVIRDGEEKAIPAKEIVPGDILVVAAGDRVAADCRLIESINIQVNEAPLTGESTPVPKNIDPVPPDTPIHDRRCMLFAGTTITFGKGKAVVVATGMRTEFGKIAREVAGVVKEETPLERRMREVGRFLGRLVMAICAMIAIIWSLEELILIGHLTSEIIIKIMLFSIALAVAAVPEALPAIVTGALAIGMREMAKRKALVRRMPAVETLGCVTVICSDKTGTLTKGEMTVKKIYVDGGLIEVTGAGYEPKGELKGEYDPDSPAFKLLMKGAILCNDSKLEVEDGKWIIRGDPTEGALIVAAMKAGYDKDRVESEYPRVDEIPFSSERKRMTTIHRTPNGGYIAFMKGAPEIVLSLCDYIQSDHEVRKLTEEDRSTIIKLNEEFAGNALRNLAIAYKPISKSRPRGDAERLERGMIFLGLMGMIDPPRPEAIEAVKTCNRIKIKPIMITGDHKLTALAIARQLGIYRDHDIVLTGEELDRLSDEEYEKIVDKVTVYARVSPMHKLRIVKAWKKRGAIVAMTGDGVNDAPAVKHADIGIAMGITGTEVTKEASDMILLDDNFATIVKAIELGRWIYDNIKKYLVYLLKSNIVEVAMLSITGMLATYLFGEFALPLLPLHILYINLATDGLPALALGVAPPDPDIMQRPPRDPKESIFSKDVLAFLILIPLINTPILMILYFWKYSMSGAIGAMTLVFLTFIFLELTVALNCRSLRFMIFRSPPHKFLVLAVLWEMFLIITITIIPATRQMFRIILPSLNDIFLIAAICVGTFFTCEAIKVFIVPRTSRPAR